MAIWASIFVECAAGRERGVDRKIAEVKRGLRDDQDGDECDNRLTLCSAAVMWLGR